MIRGMRALLACLVLFLAGWAMPQATPRPALIQEGDVLSIFVVGFEDFTTETRVASDGTIGGPGFGVVRARGRTLEQVQNDIRARLSRVIKDPQVSVSFKQQRQDFIYLVGFSIPTTTVPASGGSGPAYFPGNVPYRPGMTLLQVLAGAQFGPEPEDLVVTVIRKQADVLNQPLDLLLGETAHQYDIPLEPNDTILVRPRPTIRVWFLGPVRAPGEVRLREGATLGQAMGRAGGLDVNNPLLRGGDFGSPALRLDRIKVVVRRGPETFTFPSDLGPEGNTFVVENGDTISLSLPATRTVVVAGQVMRPGQTVVTENSTLLGAIASAGGLNPKGSLQGVLVFRRDEVRQFDLSPTVTGQLPEDMELQSDDLIVVPETTASVYVLGEVRAAGRVFLRDGETMRLSAAVAEAGGVSPNGSYRRIIVMRADSEGKLQPIQVNLDEFLKDGKLEANPQLQSGDVVFVSPPRNRINISEITQVISAAILLDSFRRR